jgi:hypothetical protein
MMKKDRMSLPRVRAPEEDYVRFFDFAVGTCSAPRSENRRQTGDARGVSSTVAAIYIVAADDRANEFLRGVIELVGRFGATEHAESARTVCSDLGAESIGGARECFVPGRRAMLAIFADEWSCEPFACRA